MRFIVLSTTTVLLLTAALLPGQTTRTDFSGTWKLDAGKCENSSLKGGEIIWTVHQQDSEIAITEVLHDNGKEQKYHLQCGAMGKDCDTKTPDGQAKVSMWFNGPALVQMETLGKGDRIQKRKMTLTNDGRTLEVEITHIVPNGKMEKLVFEKQPDTAVISKAQ